MSYGGPVHPDVVIPAEVQELSAGELGVVVGDDGVWDPEAMDDVLLNCVGALLGYAFFSRCLRDARRTQEKQDAPGAPGTVG